MAPTKSMRVEDTSRKPMNDVDRITQLPDHVIHHIFSFLDSKASVRSSLLSNKWRDTWKSDPHLKFEINPSTGHKFRNFVHRFLSDRNHKVDLSTIDFVSNSIPLRLLKEIITYAISHGTHKLNIEYLNCIPTRRGGLDSSLFKSSFLKDLRLNIDFELFKYPNTTWDLPALTTLHLERITFTSFYPPNNDGSTGNKFLELFSSLSNLKHLVLVDCRLWGLNTFYITSTRLETLSLNCLHHSCKFVISAPKLLSFTYDHMFPALLIANDLDSLERVNYRTICECTIGERPEYVELMINAFHQLYKAKFLILNADALTLLSRFPNLHERGGCPFVRLQTLTLNGVLSYSVRFSDIISYFCRGLPDDMVHLEYNLASLNNHDIGCSCGLQVIVRFRKPQVFIDNEGQTVWKAEILSLEKPPWRSPTSQILDTML